MCLMWLALLALHHHDMFLSLMEGLGGICEALCARVLQLPAFREFREEHYSESYAVILGTSAIALAYNIVHSLMIQQTSAVTTTVIGQAKIIGLLMLSAIILGVLSPDN